MTRDELFLLVSKDDRDAANFLCAIVDVLHVWDDLIDQDSNLTLNAINGAFTAALIGLPNNPFYAKHFQVLNPILLSAINNWHVANVLENGSSEADKRIAFISRSSYIDLITQVAYIVGGHEWVMHVGPDIRRFAHGEGWEGYLQNLKQEQDERALRQGKTKG